jgi:hypothetical protein
MNEDNIDNLNDDYSYQKIVNYNLQFINTSTRVFNEQKYAGEQNYVLVAGLMLPPYYQSYSDYPNLVYTTTSSGFKIFDEKPTYPQIRIKIIENTIKHQPNSRQSFRSKFHFSFKNNLNSDKSDANFLI